MKLSHTAVIAPALFAVAQAAAESDVQFLTALVSDLKSNPKQYLNFLQTAKDVPPVLTSLAPKINTYTDDSYTTLLDDSSLDISSIEAYATNLPWYSRLKAQAAGSGSVSDSASGSASGSESGVTVTSASSDSKSASADSKSDFKSDSKSSSSKSSSESSSGSKGGAETFYAPVGAVVGALAVALL